MDSASQSISDPIDPLAALASATADHAPPLHFPGLAEPDPHSRIRTLIPLLLTGAMLLILTGLLEWIVEPENPLAAPFAACPYILILLGLLIGAIAAGNMINVRSALRAGGRKKASRK